MKSVFDNERKMVFTTTFTHPPFLHGKLPLLVFPSRQRTLSNHNQRRTHQEVGNVKQSSFLLPTPKSPLASHLPHTHAHKHTHTHTRTPSILLPFHKSIFPHLFCPPVPRSHTHHQPTRPFQLKMERVRRWCQQCHGWRKPIPDRGGLCIESIRDVQTLDCH